MALTDLDWDEELKRQAVISSLLAQPEVENQPDLNRVYDTAKPSSFETQTDEQVVAPPIVEAKDYHKVINQIFDTKTDEQVTAPYGEKEKPAAPESDYAPKDTGKGAAPEAYPTVAQDQGGIEQAPDALNQVERASLVKLPPQARRAELVDPDPDRNYFELNQADKPVPGFVPGSKNAILNPAAGVTPPTPVAPATTQLPNAPITPPAATQLANAPTTPPDQSRLQVAQPVVGGQGFFGGDLTQGPPGTKPNGTEDEPFWPKGDQDIALLPPGVNYIDPHDQSQKVTPGTPSTTPAPSPAQLANAPVTAPSIIPAEDWQKTIDSIWPSADTKAKTAAAPTETGPLVNPDGTPFPTKVMAVGGEEPKALIIHHTGDHHTAAQTAQVLKDRGLGVEYTIERDGNLVQIGDSGASNILPGWGPKGTGLNNRNIVGVEVAANDDKDVTPAQVATLVKLGRMYPNVQVLGHGEVNPGHKEADEGATGVKAIMADRASGSQTGEPGTTPIETLVKLDQSGINVTHFGYEKSGEEGYDPDSAAGHGKYVKDLIPGYDVALNSAGAALVGNPKPGETFQFAGKEFRYGDAVSEKLTDPRFDIFDPTGTALTGSMPVGRQVSTPAGPKKQPWDDWKTLSPDEQAATEAKIEARTQAKAQAENAAVYKLPEAQNSNIIGLYNRLETSVPDVSDQTRSQIQAKLKPEIIAQMRAKFPEIKTDDEAWAKAQSPVNALDVGQDWGSKAIGFVQQFTEPMKVGAANTDQFSVDQFLNKAMPNASDADKHNYLTKLYGMPIDQRASEIAGRLGPGFVQPGNPYRDPYFLAQALDRLSNPNFQKRQADDVAKFQEEMKRNVSSDPRLVDTGMDRIVNDTAQIPAAVAAFSNPALWPMALAQVHEQVSDGFKKEHPEWDAKTLSDKSAYATLAQFFGGLVAGHVMSAGAGEVLSAIENKAGRAIGQAVLGGTTNAAVNATTQLGTNVIAGDSPLKGVGDAALSGAIQGGVTGVVHGAGELMAPSPEAKVAPTQGEAQPPPLPEVKLPEPAVPQTHDEIVASALEAARVQAETGEPGTARVAQTPVTLDEAIQKAKADSVAAQLGGTPRNQSAASTEPSDIFPTQAHTDVYNDLVARGMDADVARNYVKNAKGATPADILTDVQTQMREQMRQPAGTPPPVSPPEAEPPPIAQQRDAPIAISYQKPAQISPELSGLVKGDSLKDSALAAAEQIQDPGAKEVARKIAALVPESSKIGVADFSKPVQTGGRDYSGQSSDGLYHSDSDTALISHQTSDPAGAIIHEATHAALSDVIRNPENYSAESQKGVQDITQAYHDAIQAAPVKGRPTWMAYGLSSPEEFTSAVLADKKFRDWLGSRNTPGVNPFNRAMQGAARIFGKRANAPRDLYERAIAGISQLGETPHVNRAGGPIYAANPFSISKAKKIALSRGVRELVTQIRRRAMTLRSNLDAVPETRPLSAAMDFADNRKDQLIGRRLKTFAEAEQLAKGKKPQVTREFARMAEEIDKGLKPRTTDPTVKAIRDMLVKHSAEDAQFMRDNGHMVQEPDGSWRPFVGFADPNDYIPRMLRDDVYKALRAPRDPDGSYSDEFKRIFNEGVAKGYWTKESELEEFVPTVGQGLTQGPLRTSLETARTKKMPSIFYDYNIDAQLRNLYSSADTRARLEAMGQSRPNSKDMFEKTVDNVNASKTLTQRQKELAIQNVKHARDEWYHTHDAGVDAKLLAFGKSTASALQTGNFYTSSKVGVGRLMATIQNKGLINTTRAIVHTLGHYMQERASARDLGLIKDHVSFQQENLFTADSMYKRWMHGLKVVIEAAGHGEINRAGAMVDQVASNLWLQSNLREIARNPNSVASRMAKEIIARRGVDLGKLQAGDLEETGNFLRSWVNDAQVSYRLMDNPIWEKTPLGRLAMQYAHAGYNQTRMLMNETAIPAIKAFRRGDGVLGARYLGRLMYFAAAAAGSEEALQWIREKLFGRDSTVASWGQAFQAWHDHDKGKSLGIVGQRLIDELRQGSFLGMAGDYVRLIGNYAAGRNEVAQVWNPNNPPALSVIIPLIEFIGKVKDQGGRFSHKDIDKLLGAVSMFRELKNVTYSGAIGVKQLTGVDLPIPGLHEAEGYREKGFAQAKLRQFFNDNQQYDTGIIKTRGSVEKSYYDDIADALFAGDSDRAKRIVTQMKLEDKKFNPKGLHEAMVLRRPVGLRSDAAAVFGKWAKDNLTEEERDRIVTSQNSFIRNAVKAGIFGPKDITSQAIGAMPKNKASLKKAILEMQLINN